MPKALENLNKINTSEVNSKADLTAAEIKTKYLANADTNIYTDALKTKLDFATLNVTGTWQTPSMINGWLVYDSVNWGNAQYKKDSSGTVWFRGLIKSGTVPAIIFTLPVGYRPIATKIFMVSCVDAVARIDVRSNGEVYINNAAAVTWVSLASIKFKAQQ